MIGFLGFRWRWAAIAALAGALSAGCDRSSSGGELSGEVQEYVRLAAALGARDKDSLDYDYASRSPPANAPSVAQIGRAAESLMGRVGEARPRDQAGRIRQAFLLDQLRAMASRARTLGGRMQPFARESADVFGVTPPQDYDHAAVAAALAELGPLLPGKGTLAERYQRFVARFVIPQSHVRAVITRAIAACRAQTVAHLPLPAGERVDVEYVSHRPWAGYSWYKGAFHSLVQFNLDFPLTVDRVVELACHETYPGHHAYNSLREQRSVRRGQRPEYAVQPTYSPQSFISEAAANIAPDIAFPPKARLAFERDVLFPLAGLDRADAEAYLRVAQLVERLGPVQLSVAQRYLDGGLEYQRAREALEAGALMADADATLKYVNQYRSYVVTYTYGRRLAGVWIDRHGGTDQEGRWSAYSDLITHDAGILLENH